MKRPLIVFLLVAGMAFAQDTVYLATFEPEDQSLVCGTWKTWQTGEDSSCKAALLNGTINYGYTRVLKFSYDLTAPEADSCGILVEFSKVEVSKIKYVNFYVKGDGSEGYPEYFYVELIGGNVVAAAEKVGGVTTEWQKVSVPVNIIEENFKHRTYVDSLKIIFNDQLPVKKGTVFIDDIFITADERFSPNALYYIESGNRYFENGKYEKAVREYQKALEAEPDNTFALVNLGVCYTKLREYQKAEKNLRKVLKIDPQAAPAHLYLAIIYDEYFYDREKAIYHYRKFLDLDTSFDFNRRRQVERWMEGR